MDIPISWILLLGGIGVFAWAYLTEPHKKDAAMGIGAIVAIVGFLGISGWVNFAGQAPTQQETPPPNWAVAIPKVISSLNWQTRTWGANSYTAATATANYYGCTDPVAGIGCDDPKEPNVNPVDSGSISSGVVSDTSKLVKTNTYYRVTLDGSTTYYDQYLGTQGNAECKGDGICRFVAPPTDAASIDNLYALFSDVTTIATLDDLFEEGGYADNTSWMNGQTHNNLTLSTNEIGCANYCADGDVLIYDESQGDGSVWIKMTISISGANKRAKNPVLCFDWEDGAVPEGNEFSALTMQLMSGTDFGIPASVLNYWKNEQCIPLGSYRNGGVSADYKITMDYDEANLDTNDDFKITLDDLGAVNGKDIHLGTKASSVSIDFDAQA